MFRGFLRGRLVRFHLKDNTTAEGVVVRVRRRMLVGAIEEYVIAKHRLEAPGAAVFVDLEGLGVVPRENVRVLQVMP